MRLMTDKDVAEQLRVSVKTVKRLVASGKLSCYRVGASLRFTPTHVSDYLSSCETAPKRKVKPYVFPY